MKFYLAPMEGITGYIYRNAHHEFFNGIDRYYAPFISPNQNHSYTSREINDVLPDNNKGYTLIPQVLTNNADAFLKTSAFLKELGYEEVNLNLGCPSGTVVSKKRGSGFLAYKEELDMFLDEIFSRAETKISIKTRLGKEDPEEFHELLAMYNKYPIEELTIHPRIQKDFYKNTPRMEYFKMAVEQSKNPLCYNGDLFTAADYERVNKEYPMITNMMLGRGVIANPGLITEIVTGEPLSKETLAKFLDKLVCDYSSVMSGDRNTLFKMKEIWCYMIHIFSNNEKYWKKIKKSDRLSEYEAAVAALLREQEIIKGAGHRPFA